MQLIARPIGRLPIAARRRVRVRGPELGGEMGPEGEGETVKKEREREKGRGGGREGGREGGRGGSVPACARVFALRRFAAGQGCDGGLLDLAD